MAQYGGDEQYVKVGEGHQQTEEYSHNPLQSTGVGHGHGTVTGAGHGHEQAGKLHRSGSGSSSSSESDGEGGRRKKKGVVEKIKDKLPGGDHGGHEQKTSNTATVGGGVGHGYGEEEAHEKKRIGHEQKTSNTATVGSGVGHGYGEEEAHEKKGLMEKIKEKLPGGNH